MKMPSTSHVPTPRDRSPLRRRLATLAMLTLIATGAPACKMLAILGQDAKQKVKPEFDKLPGSRTAVVVWTPPETLFNYPYARFELMSHVSDKLTAELAAKQQSVDVVDPRDVEDFLQKMPEAQVDPQRVGKNFDADYVIYVELVEFQIRDPQRPQFLRGRIGASITLHDMTSDADQPQMFELSPVSTVYPEDRSLPQSSSNSMQIRDQTYRKFAEEVARKFYEHTREM